MAAIRLDDILSVVRVHGETGYYRDPIWSEEVDTLCTDLDNAVLETVGTQTLADLVDLE